MTPLATQIAGARFLAGNARALLADEPRVGKTGAAVIAADIVMAEHILIITTASGRAVWRRGVETWTKYPRRVQVLDGGASILLPSTTVAVVGWAGITDPQLRAALLARRWDLVIADESHNACNFDTARTQCFYGYLLPNEHDLETKNALAHVAAAVWLLSGTPIPDNPQNLYPTLRSMCPERLAADPTRGWPDVTNRVTFRDRYCKTFPKKVGWQNYIRVFVEGRNLEELRARLDGFVLLRTQEDVGIAPPVYGFLTIDIDEAMKARALGDMDTQRILAAAEKGETKGLEMHMGPLRRLTGELKAQALVPLLAARFRAGLDKVVLMCWHRDTMAILAAGLAEFGVVTLDGSTTAKNRERAEVAFREDPEVRVFIGQITAAGEAIDLSASALLLFVELSFRPKDTKQAALRITNHTQTRPAHVQVCVVSGSIDEVLSAILLRKVGAIREVLN